MSSQSITRYMLLGLLDRVVVFLLLVVLTFVLPRLMPGDALNLMLSSDMARSMSRAETDNLRQSMGLDATISTQFLTYVTNLAQGDLGRSIQHAAFVSDLIGRALPWTLLLVLAALPVYLGISVVIGIEAGREPHGKTDRAFTGVMTLLASVPPYSAAVFLLLGFAVLWPLFPASGAEPLFPSPDLLQRSLAIARHAVLPVLALSLHEIVRFYFLTRGEAVGLSGRPFVLNARARGIGGWRERVNYFGRNLLATLLARMTDSVAALFGAVIYIEIVFAYPGIGLLLYEAILSRDHVLLQGIVLTIAALFLTVNWVLDAASANLAARG